MKEDMHLHSNYSDGKNSLEDMVKTAIKLQYDRICFTDHVRESTPWISEYFSEYLSLKHKYRDCIEIYCGIEAKVKDFSGILDVPKKLYNEIIQVAAIHRIPTNNDKYITSDNINNDIGYAKECLINTLSGLHINTNINRLAHPFSLLPILRVCKNDMEFWKKMRYIFDNSNFYIEFNVKYDNSVVPKWIWERYSNRVIYATDSHSALEMGILSEKLYPTK